MKERYRIIGSLSAPVVFLLLVDEEDKDDYDRAWAEVSQKTHRNDFCFLIVSISHWFQELPPWSAPPLLGQTFEAGGEDTLRYLLEELVPQMEQKTSGNPDRQYYLCGYSLAGLFALWSSYQTNRFTGVVAASPSVWYPDWIRYSAGHLIGCSYVYLSLGEKEEKARNRTLAAVGECIRDQYRILQEKGCRCILEWNPGNHFTDCQQRVIRGILWILERSGQINPNEEKKEN